MNSVIVLLIYEALEKIISECDTSFHLAGKFFVRFVFIYSFLVVPQTWFDKYVDRWSVVNPSIIHTSCFVSNDWVIASIKRMTKFGSIFIKLSIDHYGSSLELILWIELYLKAFRNKNWSCKIQPGSPWMDIIVFTINPFMVSFDIGIAYLHSFLIMC